MTPPDRRTARRAEIERDHRLVAATLVGALRRITHNAANIGEPEQLWKQVEAALEASREDFRRLNNARINLRAERSATFKDSKPLPDALACYRHRGNYRGVFRSMAALGAVLSRSRDSLEKPQPAVGLAEALHIRGELWTFELDDAVHVFTTPGSPSDDALARLRPPLTAVRIVAHGNHPESPFP
jgi:hypothetical protein